MTHTYSITGMTCAGCQAKVHELLSRVPAVEKITINLEQGEASIDMTRHIPTGELQSALKEYPKYGLTEGRHVMPGIQDGSGKQASTEPWFRTYKPILLVFAFITGGTLFVEAADGSFLFARWMDHFMAAFFLVFSFFKLLDISGFADSYSTYDVIARNWHDWGFLYPFAELTLGILYLTGFNPFFTNIATLTIMGISIIGVIQSLLQKRKIRCACLGAVFNLPMSTVTVIEDGLMILMSGYGLFLAARLG